MPLMVACSGETMSQNFRAKLVGLGFVQQYQAPLVANQIKDFILPALQKREDEYKAEMLRIKNN